MASDKKEPKTTKVIVHEISEQLKADIRNNSIVLPRLPEVVTNINKMVNNKDATVNSIADIIGKDPSLASRILSVTNSPAIRTSSNVTSLNMAVSRLGVKLIRDIAISMALRDAFDDQNSAFKTKLKQIWQNAMEVASHSFVLAKHKTKFPAESAMLIGLLHEIGKLPIMKYAGRYDELRDDMDKLDAVLNALNIPVGTMILKKWNFSEDFMTAIRSYKTEDYTHDGDANGADILLVSHRYVDAKRKGYLLDWDEVPASAMLNITSHVELDDLFDSSSKQLQEVMKLFD